MLTERQSHLLELIVSEHVKTAEPIASEVLVEKYNLGISSATVRNEMLELDRLGYLEQPHTSAGRIPAEKAYHEFLMKAEPKPLTVRQQKILGEAYKGADSKDKRQQVQMLAKSLADLSEEFVLTAFADNDFYYTGLSNLFSKPEFQNFSVIYNISTIIDHIDSRLSRLYHKASDKVEVLIGKENPIDSALSLVMIKNEGWAPFIALLGPIRMEYRMNIALVNYCRELLIEHA